MSSRAAIPAILAILFQSSTLFALEVIRGPYLQKMKRSEVTICFTTSEEATIDVEISGDGRSRKVSSTGTSHFVRIKDLDTHTRYQYRILNDKVPLTSKASFKTAPAHDYDGTLRGAVIGDSGKAGTAQDMVVSQMIAFKPELLLHVGDIVYPRGADSDYNAKFFDPFATLLSGTPFFPAVGNHDALSIEAYLKNYVLPEQSGTERYYSYRYGPIHFIVLDTNLDYSPGSPQYLWLEKAVAARRARSPFTVVYMHHPAYSSGPHGDTLEIQRYLVPLFKRRVNMILSGHDHIYDRSMMGEGAGRKVPYIVSGGGGTDLTSVNPGAHSHVALLAHHFVAFTAFNGSRLRRLRVKAISSTGETLDSLVIGK